MNIGALYHSNVLQLIVGEVTPKQCAIGMLNDVKLGYTKVC
jgi:hypothetical protein